MRCGKGHEHATFQEVKDCYGVGHLADARVENLVPAGPAPMNPRAREIAQKMERQEANTRAARNGQPHGFTSHCPKCVAGTHKTGDRDDVGYPDEIPLPPDPEEAPVILGTFPPTEPQLKYIRSLLTKHNLVITQSAANALTKRTASDLIGRLKDWNGGPTPPGIQLDSGKLSADGDPEGYGNPQPEERQTQRGPLPDVPEGHYAIPSLTGNNDLDFFRVDRPDEGTWKGKTYIKRVIGGKPDKNIRFSQYRPVLEAIVAFGIDHSGATYGREIGRCRHCNRHLTDDESRARGSGPDCFAQHGC